MAGRRWTWPMWCAVIAFCTLWAQPNASARQAAADEEWTREKDHRHMMDQLGISKLRPGPSGRESAPNAANYDEALANPYPDYPPLLTANDGRAVTSAEMWWKVRRPEIVEAYEREVYGRIPPNAPPVTWTVVETLPGTIGGIPVVGKHVVGRADNSAHPAITVEIQLTFVTPATAAEHVPVMIMFRRGSLRQALGLAPPERFAGPPPGGPDPPATEQLIAAGWGFAFLDPWSIQADDGAGLTKGIIGLTNKGQPRTPEQWGALRAWSWGAARALDYLETDPAVDAKHVGIEGVSRYGKAALVTMAFEPRFAVALIGSAGAGGVKPFRRNFGEAVENLTGPGQYHWMAGNFLKYGADEAVFGRKDMGDIPVDSHQLLALCAPRPVFISYGIPEQGDARWLDQKGSFMAAVAAGPAFRLLGAKDLGTGDDYRNATLPPVNSGLLDGHLAWRQHDGGHTDGPNWKHFIPWANRMLGITPPLTVPGDQPAPRLDTNSRIAHQQLLEKRKRGRIDVYFVGDSITRRWGSLDYPELLANWTRNFHGWNAANFAWGGDRTQHMLWRLHNGELDGVNPKVIVVQAGANNVGRVPGGDAKVEDIVRGIAAILDACRAKAPHAALVLTAVFPRSDSPAVAPEIRQINERLAQLAAERSVRFLNINDRIGTPEGTLAPGMSNDGLHLSLAAYQVWADALKPILTELLGPPAETDLAPPPTGDPSARTRQH
ncbi:MAG TPA: GDSL-type esterase/lipase family protein [Vicinamibacterales bacterium]|nr:GDSL-type esterase/lipase family protein [Vicinamibacterales bacterium]